MVFPEVRHLKTNKKSFLQKREEQQVEVKHRALKCQLTMQGSPQSGQEAGWQET